MRPSLFCSLDMMQHPLILDQLRNLIKQFQSWNPFALPRLLLLGTALPDHAGGALLSGGALAAYATFFLLVAGMTGMPKGRSDRRRVAVHPRRVNPVDEQQTLANLHDLGIIVEPQHAENVNR